MSEALIPVEELTFEQAFSELETIVGKLESDSPTLEESMMLFERGQSLSKYCSTLLEEAELHVQQLTGQELDELLDDSN